VIPPLVIIPNAFIGDYVVAFARSRDGVFTAEWGDGLKDFAACAASPADALAALYEQIREHYEPLSPRMAALADKLDKPLFA
jgi:hypothetical protein